MIPLDSTFSVPQVGPSTNWCSASESGPRLRPRLLEPIHELRREQVWGRAGI